MKFNIYTLIKNINTKIIFNFLFSYRFLFIFFSFLVFFYIWTYPFIQKEGTIKIYDRNGTLIFEKAQNVGKKEFVPLSSISPYVIKSVIIHEDKNYWDHSGVDFISMVRAFRDNLLNKRVISGASTITQQYARIAVPYLKRNGVSYIRKLREVFVALRINRELSKEQLLEGYLNSIYFGNKVYGISSASKYYFGKDADSLSLSESAMLVGFISSPSNNPIADYDSAIELRNNVLKELYDAGEITKEEYDNALSEKIFIHKDIESLNSGIYFAEYVLSQLNDFGISDKELEKGVKVFTTFDLNINNELSEIAKYNVNQLKDEHNLSNAAVVLINNEDRSIVGMVGGVDYKELDSGTVNMTVANRQPGSSIKPITYALAFMNGYTPDSEIEDAAKRYVLKDGNTFIPHNYDNKYRGIVNLRTALASSLNMPAVELLNNLGIDKFLDLSKALGITTFNRVSDYDLAVTLGGAEVNLLELSNVYSTFANDGKFLKTYGISTVTNDSGNLLYRHEVGVETYPLGKDGKVVSEYITSILSDNEARSIGFGYRSPLALSFSAAVKTGTTTDWHDNWTIGYNDQYTIGVWVGNNNNEPLSNLTGVTGAAPIWRDSFELLMKNKIKEVDNSLGLNPENNNFSETNLLETDDPLQIIFPKNNSEFVLQENIVQEENMVFEIYTNELINDVTWVLDGSVIDTTNGGDHKIIWQPTVGKHILEVKSGNFYDKSEFNILSKEEKDLF